MSTNSYLPKSVSRNKLTRILILNPIVFVPTKMIFFSLNAFVNSIFGCVEFSIDAFLEV